MIKHNDVIVITGGSSGLGRSIASMISESYKDVTILLLARNEDKMKETKAFLESKGVKSNYYKCDVSKSADIEKAFREIYTEYKKIDILINNAGIWFEGKTSEHSPNKVQELFDINIVGMVNATNQVLDKMIEMKTGQILNISSVAGVEPNGGWTVYSATKHAVSGFTDSLKDEAKGTGVKIMCFYPGGMNTNIFETAGYGKNVEPWMMEVNDVAKVIVFMLSQPDDVVMDHVEVRKVMRGRTE